MNSKASLRVSLMAAALLGIADLAAAQATADEFVSLSAAEGVTPEDWFSLAQRAREAGDFDTARLALANAPQLPASQQMLERARIAVSAGAADDAIDILQAAVDNGFAAVRLVTGDDVLRGLAGNARYEALVEALNRQAFPCRYDDRFRQFDFWIGAWDVHTAAGQYAGSNVIRREESGCVLTEHWTGASGTTGSSINFVDKTTNEWVQVWNSEGGAQISIRGKLTPEGMSLIGRIHYVGNGTTADFRGLWTPLDDGRVRQFFEQSTDGGQSWSPWFEGFYTRRSGAEGEI